MIYWINPGIINYKKESIRKLTYSRQNDILLVTFNSNCKHYTALYQTELIHKLIALQRNKYQISCVQKKAIEHREIKRSKIFNIQGEDSLDTPASKFSIGDQSLGLAKGGLWSLDLYNEAETSQDKEANES